MTLDELENKRKQLKSNSDDTIAKMKSLTDETNRVADLAHNSREVLDNLDKKFEAKTGLQGNDIKFLFVAVGLQLARIAVISYFTQIDKAGASNKNETRLHKHQEKILSKFNADGITSEKPYYASMKHIITKLGVPYDATAPLTEEAITKLLGKDSTWSFDLSDLMPTEKLELFKGANHRFSTLGHDPILGLLFGTANIMTNTITCVKTPMLSGKLGIPTITTNHVIYTSDYKDPRIATYAPTAMMLEQAYERTIEQPSAFVAALIKQVIHIKTDLYTKCGIQLPALNLILSNSNVEKITGNISMGDIKKAGKSAFVAEMLNVLISAIHTLMCDSLTDMDRNLYNVRTRKIITISNEIAQGANLLWVGGNMIAGNEGAIKQLDFGGLLVLIKHLIDDSKFITQLKKEYVFGTFDKMIQGNIE